MTRMVSRQKVRRDTNKMNTKSESLDKALTPREKELLDEIKKLNNIIDKNKSLGQKVEDDSIPLNKNIKVMSLCNNKLNLSTQPRGSGHRYSFEKFGEVKKIQYGDLLAINENHRNFKEAGYYYILDDRVVEEEGLTYVYEKILSKEKIDRILSNSEDAVSLFQVANPKQQKIVIDMIVSKLINDEFVDFNLVNNIDRVLNPDSDPKYIGIVARANTAKEISKIKNE